MAKKGMSRIMDDSGWPRRRSRAMPAQVSGWVSIKSGRAAIQDPYQRILGTPGHFEPDNGDWITCSDYF